MASSMNTMRSNPEGEEGQGQDRMPGGSSRPVMPWQYNKIQTHLNIIRRHADLITECMQNLSVQQNSSACYICKDPNHWARDCPKKQEHSACYICKDPSHWANDCPKKQSSFSCYICKEKGHYANVCPEKQNKGTLTDLEPEVVEDLMHDLPDDNGLPEPKMKKNAENIKKKQVSKRQVKRKRNQTV